MSKKPTSFTLPFLRKKELTKNTYSFFFDRSHVPFDFVCGQYVQMILPHSDADDRGTSRYFTIASSPLEKNVLMITAKIIRSSFKNTLLALQPGTAVSFFGPIGYFPFNEDDTHQHVLLSGGMGITPFHSLLHYAVEKKLRVPLTLLASFGRKEESIFYDDLTSFARNHEHIQVVYTLTRLDQDEQWQGERGRITEELIKKYVHDVTSARFYVIGPMDMVESTKELLVTMRVDEVQIMTEDFTGY